MKFLSLCAIFFMFSSVALATWTEDFEALRNVSRSYEDSGAICEEVARLAIEKEYPSPQFSVLLGIAYADEVRTIGELDVVVFDNNIQKVIKIGEVKCWKDVPAGLAKAQEQRARFMKTVRSSKKVIFRSTSSQEVFDADKFAHAREFFSMGQKGSVAVGFDRELKYTLKEMHDHRLDMIRCQHQGLCARP